MTESEMKQIELARLAAVVAAGLVQTDDWGCEGASQVAHMSIAIAIAIQEKAEEEHL